jgi:phage terminase large subunit-like protein
MALVDELHVVADDTFEAMSARAGKRDRSLLLAISTPPPAGDDGVMRRLVDHGREGADPSFYFREFAAPPGCQVDDEQAWEVANPAPDDFLHRDALRATLPPKMRENAFRRYRLGQWVGADAAWLPDGAWPACADATRSIPDGAEVALALTGLQRRARSNCWMARASPSWSIRSPQAGWRRPRPGSTRRS